MDDLISRQALLKQPLDTANYPSNYVRNAPPVAIPSAEPRTGHWIMPQQDDGMSDPIYYQVRCSKCDFDLDPQTWHMELHQYGADKYCPSCGAKMVEEQESEEV